MGINSIIDALREQIDKKHQDAIQALKTIAVYLEEPIAPSNRAGGVLGATAPLENEDAGGTSVTRVKLVFRTISRRPKTVEQIMQETGLPENAVRAALYSKSSRKRLLRRKVGKKMEFKLKAPLRDDVDQGSEPGNAAAMVRELLATHPEGLTSGQIHDLLAADLESRGINKAAVGAALYNMKKRGKLSHNEQTGIYALASTKAEMQLNTATQNH